MGDRRAGSTGRVQRGVRKAPDAPGEQIVESGVDRGSDSRIGVEAPIGRYVLAYPSNACQRRPQIVAHPGTSQQQASGIAKRGMGLPPFGRAGHSRAASDL
jgi:hypothetical protein